MITRLQIILTLVLALHLALPARADDISITEVDGQPLGANVLRVLAILEYLGAPLDARTKGGLILAARRGGVAKTARPPRVAGRFAQPGIASESQAWPGSCHAAAGGFYTDPGQSDQ